MHAAGETGRAASGRLKKRRQFLALNGGARGFASALVLQARARDYAGAGEAEGPRFGFTVTKKVGNAVVRNRIRRRLKAAVAGLSADALRPDHDYVVIAKRPALTMPFEALSEELARSIAKAHRTEAHRTEAHRTKAHRTSVDQRDGDRARDTVPRDETH